MSQTQLATHVEGPFSSMVTPAGQIRNDVNPPLLRRSSTGKVSSGATPEAADLKPSFRSAPFAAIAAGATAPKARL
jgi:hypothetical protein